MDATASTDASDRPVRREVVGHLDDLAEGSMKLVKVNGRRVCLIRTAEGVFALDQACPHEGYGLTTGQLDGNTVTCAWHNWKFRVSDGRCVLGEEDVVSHDVDIANDGTLTITLDDPDPAEKRPVLLASLRSAIEKDYMGQASRDVIRLLRADADPGQLIWEAVAYGAPRAEFGWGHSIASLTDCLTMVDRYDGDQRALPIVQAIAGVAHTERGRPPWSLPDPLAALPDNPGAELRRLVEAEQLEPAMALVLGALEDGRGRDELQSWFTPLVSDHLLAYGHGAIYAQKAFQLLDGIGWERAATVLPHLLPSIVYGTREDTLPYCVPFHRGLVDVSWEALAEASTDADDAAAEDARSDHGRLASALLDADRGEAARAATAAILAGAGLEAVLDAVVFAVSERMLRYDVAGERDFHDDFGWLDITHGLTYANAARWHVAEARRTGDVDPVDLVRLVLWTVFLANWTGRHEWHTTVHRTQQVDSLGSDLRSYGTALQDLALQDGTTAFIVHAHAVKMSVAATEEALRLDDRRPLDATHRFLTAPKLERFVAANVTRSIDFLSGRVMRV
ncbi:MAG: Rieske (2Fe-2S) protein [Acidimicrobiia bacterium]